MTSQRLTLLATTIFGGVALVATPATAQNAFQATPTVVVPGTAAVLQGAAPNKDVISVYAPQVVINWVPTDSGIGGGPISILPAGSSAIFIAASPPSGISVLPPPANYTVFNRILPVDPTRAVQFDGLVQSRLFAAGVPPPQGGSLWFYSPGGVIAGPTAVFDIGSLVLTSNDIDTTGGLFGPTGQIRFRGAGGGTSAVSVSNGALIGSAVAGSYVALVAPRVVQSGTINIAGSVALVAAEQVDVRINNGLFDIAFIVGSDDPNGIVHTGNTVGSAATATDPNHGVYLAVMPKNSAITMLVGGNLGYGAVAAGVVNDTVVLTSGLDLFNGTPGGSAAPTTAVGNININANTPKLATNFTSGMLGAATGTTTADPGLLGGTINFAGPATLRGDVGVIVNASQGSFVTAQGDLTLDSSSQSGVGGNTSLSATFNPVLLGQQSSVVVVGNLSLNSSAAGGGGNAFGGTSTIAANNGLINVAGTTTLNAGATGFSGDVSNGDGTAGQATISTGGLQSSLALLGDTVISSNGVGGISFSSGGTPTQAGAGTGGIATFTNGGGTANFGNLTVSASGTGGVGHVGGIGAAGVGGTGDGGIASVTLNLGQTKFSGLVVNADGIGGDGLNGGGANAPGVGGNGVGGSASLIIPVGGGTANGTAVTISASGLGGNGNSTKALSSGSAGGSGTGGTTNATFAGGSLTLNGLYTQTADGVGGSGGNGSGAGQAGGIGGAGLAGVDNLTLSGGSVVTQSMNLSAAANGGGGGSAQGDAGAGGGAVGGTIQMIDTAGGNAFGTVNLLADALGGSGGLSINGAGGAGGAVVGGSATYTTSASETFGSLSIDASLRGGSGGNGLQGGNGGSAMSSGIAQFVVNGGTLNLSQTTLTAQASGGFGGDGGVAAGNGGNAQAGTARFVTATGATVNVSGLLLNASGAGGFGGNGLNSFTVAGAGGNGGSGTGGTAAIDQNGGALRLNLVGMYIDTLDASGNGGAGGIGGSGGAFSNPLGQGNNGGAGGAGVGGAAIVNVRNAASLSLTNPLSVLANAAGGLGGVAGINGTPATGNFGASGGAGGAATGGSASIIIANGASVVGSVDIVINSGALGAGGGNGADGTVGGNGGNGGDALGGVASLVVDPSILSANSLNLNASAASGAGGFGGNGSTTAAGIIDVTGSTSSPASIFPTSPLPGNGGGGGNGGNSTGGTALLQALGSAVTSLTTTLDASAVGGNAGLGGVAPANMINTGAVGVLTANFLNGVARTGNVAAGSATISASDGAANVPSTASLGNTLIDVSGNKALELYYVPVATVVSGVVQDFASFFTINALEAGGRAGVSYASNVGGGGLQFNNLTVNAIGGTGNPLASGARGIFISGQADPTTVAGATQLQSLFNPIQFDIAGNGTFSAGALTASGNNISATHTPQNATGSALTIDSTSVLFNALGSFTANPGTIINSSGTLTINATSGSILADRLRAANAALTAVNGPVTVNTDLQVTGAATATGTAVTLNSLGPLALTQAIASAGALTVNTRGLLSINGIATGQTVTLVSPDIAIDTSEGQVGTAGQTTAVNLTNNGAARTFVGDSNTIGGYRLSNAEAQRIFANNINIAAPQITAGTGLNTNPADLVIGTLGLAANGVNLGANGALNFTTLGKVRIVGAASINNASANNVININAGGSIELLATTGSLGLFNNGVLAGQINLTAPDIIAASPAAFTGVLNAPNGVIINDVLGKNEGIINNAGYFSANAMRFTVQNGLYIQNSGADTTSNVNYAARRGLTVGAGGLTIVTGAPNARIFINGRQSVGTAAAPAFVTGLDFIPTLRIGAISNLNGRSNFDFLSTANGCLIAVAPVCQSDVGDGPSSKDTTAKSTENSGFGPMQFTSLVELKDVVPLGYQPLVDDPVTGAGNDDLWAGEDAKKRK